MMKRLILVSLVGLTGCGSATTSESRGGGGGVSGSTPGSAATGSVGGDAGQPVGSGGGTLTAGAWDDNLNFDNYLGYLSRLEAQGIQGMPRVDHADRMTIHVLDGSGAPLPGATVQINAACKSFMTGVSGADGSVVFFPTWVGLPARSQATVTARTAEGMQTLNVMTGDAQATLTIQAAHAQAVAALDVTFVLDTTGSMGDELAYLSTEFEGIAADLATRFPGVSQRWGLVLYRDVGMGDEYSVRPFGFTSDTAVFKTNLAAQRASGGGDYPESPELGLAAAAKLDWRPGAVARLVFWVGDAPHHAGNEEALLGSFGALYGLGVHVYPVSASGTDDLLEYSMRAGAELTGGRYLFLTNDSGVGNDHKAPTIPCYRVTKLKSAITRMVAMELNGGIVEPSPSEILRVGGEIVNGYCASEGIDGGTLRPL